MLRSPESNSACKTLYPSSSLQRFLQQSGGREGGWDQYDHQTFVRIRRKFDVSVFRCTDIAHGCTDYSANTTDNCKLRKLHEPGILLLIFKLIVIKTCQPLPLRVHNFLCFVKTSWFYLSFLLALRASLQGSVWVHRGCSTGTTNKDAL